jgi:hypothetical protein
MSSITACPVRTVGPVSRAVEASRRDHNDSHMRRSPRS